MLNPNPALYTIEHGSPFGGSSRDDIRTSHAYEVTDTAVGRCIDLAQWTARRYSGEPPSIKWLVRGTGQTRG